MNYVIGHISLKVAMMRKITPAQVLSLRGKIGLLDEHSGMVFVSISEHENFLLDVDMCVRIPEIGEDVDDRHVINVCNVDEESVFDRMSVIIVYVKNDRMMAEEVKEFWRTL